MKALGCLVRSLNDKFIYLTANICIHLMLPEFYIFCRHKKLKEIELYVSWKIVCNYIPTYFLFQRADRVGILG